MPQLILLFLLLPFLDLWLLIRIGTVLGVGPTIALTLLMAVVGAAAAKHEGLRVMRGWQQATSQGRMPPEGILDGVLVLVGAVLLISPGVLTDLIGFLLLIPPTRRLVARVVRSRLERRVRVHVQQRGPRERVPPARDQVIDVEARSTAREQDDVTDGR